MNVEHTEISTVEAPGLLEGRTTPLTEAELEVILANTGETFQTPEDLTPEVDHVTVH